MTKLIVTPNKNISIEGLNFLKGQNYLVRVSDDYSGDLDKTSHLVYGETIEEDLYRNTSYIKYTQIFGHNNFIKLFKDFTIIHAEDLSEEPVYIYKLEYIKKFTGIERKLTKFRLLDIAENWHFKVKISDFDFIIPDIHTVIDSSARVSTWFFNLTSEDYADIQLKAKMSKKLWL